MNTVSDNKRIAKNTMMLYLRMFITMAISLYTSRLVLDVLGVVDFGVYNIVGGIVVVFSVLNGTLSTSTQRFLTVELGKSSGNKIKDVFSTSLIVHIIVAGIIVLLSETVGLWFLNTQLSIPQDRLIVANWIYQFSILTCVLQLNTLPFSGVVIAHERMNVYAWLSIYNVIVKLLLVILISNLPSDKLMLYGLVMLSIQIMETAFYVLYTRKFSEVVLPTLWRSDLIRDFGKFAGWNLFGSISEVGYTQGINFLLNIYFGPVVNAARAIGVQVLAAAHSFVFNFQLAATPQITKTYASGEYERMHKLIFLSSKVSFCLTFLIAVPLILEMPFVLNLWLTQVPDYTVIFVRLVILTMLFDSTAGPLVFSLNATGNIKKYQLIINGLFLMVLPISWFFLWKGYPPQTVYVVYLVLVIIVQVLRIFIILPQIYLSKSVYIKEVLIKLTLLIICGIPLPVLLYAIMSPGVFRFIIIGAASLFFIPLSMYLVVMSQHERDMVKDMIKSRLPQVV